MTVADLLAIPEPERFHEIIGGELVRKAVPSARHGSSQANLAGRLAGPYGRRPGGRSPGGWRFMTEVEVLFEDHEVYRPDVTGWRRERMPELPEEIPVTLRPDWVCEILSPSNARNDIVKKMLTYQRARVPHYWLIEPVTEALVVYRWTEAGNLLVQSAQHDERIRAERFDGVSLSVRSLLEGDDSED
jgi:Uma2 family endonuclease